MTNSAFIARRACLLLLGLVLAACGDDEPRAPASPTTPSVVEETPAAPEPPAGRPAAEADAPTPPAPLTAAQREELRAAIRDGRRAAHDGRHAEALRHFERAAELAPSSGRLRCEAAFVAYQGADLARADAHLAVALAALPRDASLREEQRRPTAMCLYNAGLVHEARGRLPAARDAWRRSVALRPNRVVSDRLAALEARLEETGPGEADPSAGLGPFPPTTSFEDVAARVRETLCEGGGGGFTRDELESCDQIRVEIRRVGGGPLEAATLAFEVLVPAGGVEHWLVLAVRGAGALHVVRLAQGYSPGTMGMSTDAGAELEASDVLPGGAPEIVARLHADAGDSDMGSCDYWGYGHAATIVCSVDGGALRCAAIPLVDVQVTTHESPCDSFYGDEGEDEALDERSGYEMVLRFQGGRAFVTRNPDGRSADTPPLIGEHSVTELLDRRDLAWPATWTVLDLVAG